MGKFKVKKQSLNRILKDLSKNNTIILKKGDDDSRKRLIYLNDNGKKLFNEIFLEQKRRIYNAFKNSNASAVIESKNLLKKIING